MREGAVTHCPVAGPLDAHDRAILGALRLRANPRRAAEVDVCVERQVVVQNEGDTRGWGRMAYEATRSPSRSSDAALKSTREGGVALRRGREGRERRGQFWQATIILSVTLARLPLPTAPSSCQRLMHEHAVRAPCSKPWGNYVWPRFCCLHTVRLPRAVDPPPAGPSGMAGARHSNSNSKIGAGGTFALVMLPLCMHKQTNPSPHLTKSRPRWVD